MKVYKLHPNVEVPTYGTSSAACFDLKAFFENTTHLMAYAEVEGITQKFKLIVSDESVIIEPGMRVIVPTGMIFDIPEGYSIRIHPRSGLSLKSGITLSNSEGVIDSDYREETGILLYNSSNADFVLKQGMRVAQGELVKDSRVNFEEIFEMPKRVGNRIGGMGSTGV